VSGQEEARRCPTAGFQFTHLSRSAAAMFVASFLGLSVVAAALHVTANYSSSGSKKTSGAPSSPTAALPEGFTKFQRSFLTVALLAWFADWLQGAYVYALYKSYGFDQVSQLSNMHATTTNTLATDGFACRHTKY
jgi:Sugar-tranasporters, 12 TM